uniref:NADH-ubiquinone oxidoreductase chain 3 n=1 Tax=Nerthra indica TaxID=1249914 RepID=C5HIL7_9HEMI|nr:NADH dehydrogenase subunit 3 [Nerthra indica]ACJ69462.1 NADH dehydrogenase subunit 3 [Nerthra indica]
MILMMMLTMALTTTLSIIIMMICIMVSKKTIIDREKMSPFECGFDPKSSARTPFSIQFFLISVLFLIFDIEIVIIMPMIITIKTSNPLSWFCVVSMFIIILLTGLFHEWNNGILEWAT